MTEAPLVAPSAPAQASVAFARHNPDVLTCIANLSNDEVFTPPAFANQMLDTLAEAWAESNDGSSIWADSTVTFLDPFTKSGVFLREIVARLTEGLADAIPDLQERVDHILTKQVFGIGITQLTSLLARRSVYCSKDATGKHSIAKSFDRDWGNIWFERTEHTWAGAQCAYCGANKGEYARSEVLETHAYAFIHASDIKARITQMFGANMQFDVIIGNPPYQLADGGGGGSARPIYHLFIRQAQALEPRFVSMVTPSRWFQGGRGLDEFRGAMLSDRRLKRIVDYIVAADAFHNININGGVNYFLWDADHQGECQVTVHSAGARESTTVTRSLDEFDLFVRRNESVSILRAVQGAAHESFSSRVSSTRPFGLRTDFHGDSESSSANDVKLFGSGRVSWVSRARIAANESWVDRWKVLIPAATDGNEVYPLPIWDHAGPFVSGPGEACTETYIVAALADDRAQAERFASYMRTKFFRFLVSLRKVAQHNKADNFRFVPDLPMDREWSDTELFAKFGLAQDQIEFIDSQIRSINFSNA